eukprot:803936-Prorocentrum_minimum.AAC.7
MTRTRKKRRLLLPRRSPPKLLTAQRGKVQGTLGKRWLEIQNWQSLAKVRFRFLFFSTSHKLKGRWATWAFKKGRIFWSNIGWSLYSLLVVQGEASRILVEANVRERLRILPSQAGTSACTLFAFFPLLLARLHHTHRQ